MSTVPAAALPTTSPRIPWWLWLNVLSLDAPIVAVLWQAALARSHKVVLMPEVYKALFLAVWLIYMLDRVLDGFCIKDTQKGSVRHEFYRRNRWVFLLAVIPFGTVSLLLFAASALPAGVMWRGVALGFVVALYLLHYAARGHRPLYVIGNVLACAVGGFVLWVLPLPVHYKWIYGTVLAALLMLAFTKRANGGMRLLPKELLCGFLFAMGCSLAVHFHTGDAGAFWFSLETLLLAFLCTLNCIAISCYERGTDMHHDRDALAQTWPQIARVYPALLLTLAALAVFAVTRHVPQELLLFGFAILLSTLLLGVVHQLAKRLSPDLAHVLADAALALPMMWLVFAA
ncbi:MAG: hypothetical protein ACOYMN_03570 [Roseimicrobium sp.]